MVDVVAPIYSICSCFSFVTDILLLNNYAGRCYAKCGRWNSDCGRYVPPRLLVTVK